MSELILKFAVVGLIVIAIGLAVWEYGHKRYEAGVATVTAEWNLDKEKIATTTAIAIANANRKTAEAEATNRRLHDVYQAKLIAADAGTSELARRLRLAEARAAANRGTVPAVHSGQGSSPTSQAPSNGLLNGAIAAALDECKANDAQLNALIGEVSPQVDK
jgi:hypothetical protein